MKERSMRRWTIDSINNWYNKLPYLAGANFTPSTACNQLEMWQEATFDAETIRRELGWARDLGMNLMRVYLHDLAWEQDREGFIGRIERYLAIADGLGISTSFVLFDDCWNPTPRIGPQPGPIPFVHNSRWLQSPGIGVVNDPRQWPRLEAYVKGILEHFKGDSRILYWDLYNEPGNGPGGDPSAHGRLQGSKSLPLLKKTFEWARSVERLSQPLTAGVWNVAQLFWRLVRFSLSHSDLVTFHCYGDTKDLRRKIARFRRRGRPLVCTEYMARPRSTFEEALPILRSERVGAVNWGLVAGRTNTIYPWNWSAEKGEPDPYFHDILWPDGSFLYPREMNIIRSQLRPDRK
jgi:hypothetical protein